ncbi:MAG: tyrosine-type recombinase/integrase [Planctomycetes bacterium]|nr:tyrosine-type recombinase/integrase [Planctomycetota bacterium]
MASIYKRSYKEGDGASVECETFTAEVKIGDGFQRMPGFRDRKATEELARRVERLAMLRAAGDTPDAALTAFLDGLPTKQRDKLCEFGLLDESARQSKTPLTTHLESFRQALRDLDATPIHVEKTCNRVAAILAGTGATTIRTLTAESGARYLAERRKLTRKKGGLSVKSSNHYAAAAKSFCEWLVESNRARHNPLGKLAKLNVDSDRRHVRRALESAEVARLLTATRKGAESFGMSGEARFWLYTLAVESGLRSAELRSLTRASFDLGENPTVTVAAKDAKNRTAATLPLRRETADGLRKFLADKLPAASVFKLPRPEQVVEMLRVDLDEADIDYRDGAKRVADFHSLRVTFASLLLRSGVDVRTAKELMRHSSITLTADVYAVTMRGSLADAVSRLPSFAAVAASANGTDGQPVKTDGVSAGGRTGGRTGGNRAPNRRSRFAHVRDSRDAEPRRNAGNSSAKRDPMRGKSGTATTGETLPPRGFEPLFSA